MLRTSLTVRLDAEAQSVSVVRTICSAALARLGVTGGCADEVALALAEACTNAVEHSQLGSDERDEPDGAHGPGTFEVRVDVVGIWCHIEVIDHGSGFDADGTAGCLPDPGAIRGRGIAIMRQMTDDLVVQSAIGAGTRVLLSKRLVVEDWSPLGGSGQPGHVLSS
jgi:serine/threonine-protein kinase RsbW